MKDLIAKYVDKEGSILLAGMRVNVRIIDVRKNFGETQWLVAPLSGMGQAWFTQDPLLPILDNEKDK